MKEVIIDDVLRWWEQCREQALLNVKEFEMSGDIEKKAHFQGMADCYRLCIDHLRESKKF